MVFQETRAEQAQRTNFFSGETAEIGKCKNRQAFTFEGFERGGRIPRVFLTCT